MGFSASMISLANRLISDTEKSAAVTFTAVTAGAYSAGAYTAESTTDYSVQAVLLSFKDRDINGVSVKMGDIRVLIDSTQLGTVTPKTDDRITVGATQYKLIAVTPVYAGPSVAYYDMQVRAGE